MNDFLKNDDILVLSDSYWDAPKRVRHKMPLAWAREGNRVLWIESPFLYYDRTFPGKLSASLAGGIREKEERLFVARAFPGIRGLLYLGSPGRMLLNLHYRLLARRIGKYLAKLDMKPRLLVLWQEACFHPLIPLIDHKISIYYANDIYGYGKARPRDQLVLKDCCKSVDAVFATSRAVHDQLKVHNPRTRHIPHAVDLEWWERNHESVPEEYNRIPPPRVVFTGVVDSRIDGAFLQAVAGGSPRFQFIMVGPMKGAGVGLDRTITAKNVHFLGGKSPDELPGYIQGADILMFPYGKGELCDHIGLPLKFYEYCISGKPILSTPFTSFETESRQLVYVRSTPEEWIAGIRDLLSGGQGGELKAKARIELAVQNTYRHRIKEQKRFLSETAGGIDGK